MKGTVNLNNFTQLATDYVSTKQRKRFYEVVALTEDNLEEVIYLQPFSEDECKAIRSLKDNYGEDHYIDHLDEVFIDPEDLYELSYGQDIVHIDIDNPSYKYKFALHEFDNNKYTRRSLDVIMDDEQYIKALSLFLSDSEMNFNKLQFACSFLYDIIYSQIVHTLCDERFYFSSYPFLITMDEIRKDAMNIRAMNPELECQTGIGYYCNI